MIDIQCHMLVQLENVQGFLLVIAYGTFGMFHISDGHRVL